MKVKVQDNSQDVSNITSYTWAKDNTDKSYESNICPDGNYQTIINETDEPEICIVNNEGWYKATATNSRNNSTNSDVSAPVYYRVTNPAKPIEIVEDLPETGFYETELPHIKLSAAGIPFDSITVQWYAETLDTRTLQAEKTYSATDFNIDNSLIAHYSGEKFASGTNARAVIITYYNTSTSSCETRSSTVFAKQ